MNAVFICKKIWTTFRVRVNFVGSLMVSQIYQPGARLRVTCVRLVQQ